MGDKISQLPVATSVDGTELIPIVQDGDTKQVTGLILRNPAGPASGDLAGNFPNPTLAAITTAETVGSATEIPVVTVDTKGRVTGMTTAANPQGTVTSVVGGTGLTGGTITSTGTLAVSYGTTAGTAAQGNDSRLSDSRTPTGAAGGDLTGTYPNPTLSAVTTAQSNIGSGTQIPVISVDAKGRVTSLSSVAASAPASAITALTGDVTASGPGSAPATLASITTAQTNIGSSTSVPVISVDAKGRITSLGSTPISGTAGGTVTSVIAGTGLSGGTITGSGTIAIADVTTAQTAVGTGTAVPVITVNAQGQITTLTTTAITATGTVTSITAGSGLSTSGAGGSGGSITSTGTIDISDVTTAQTAVGSSTTIPVITVNTKGQITTLTTAAIDAGLQLSSTAPSNLASVAAVGVGTTAARSDHQHAFPTAAEVGAEPAISTLAVNKGGTGETSYTDGQILIGNSTGNTLAKTTLTAGSNVTITNGPGTITIAASLSSSSYIVDTLIVAGGGGASSGGGGAGGAVAQAITMTSGAVYTITVGAGGAGALTAGTANAGSNSSISSLIALGGGRSGITGNPAGTGGNGGSGGGAGANTSVTSVASPGGSGTYGQGRNGGATPSLAASPTGGGGGAGGVGASGASGAAGNGGIGLLSSITGTGVYYAGGGGGSISSSGTNGTGGLGGGGNGTSSGTAQSGTANTGGGGGGANGTSTPTGGNGGSGVVILLIPTASYTGTTTGSPVVTTSGSNTVVKFNSSGTYTA